MASLLRQSTRQLSRSVARSPQILLLRGPSIQLARTSRLPASACLAHLSRQYSSKQPPPQKKNGKEKNSAPPSGQANNNPKSGDAAAAAANAKNTADKAENETPPQPEGDNGSPRPQPAAEDGSSSQPRSLPEGWVRLSDEEMTVINSFFESLPVTRESQKEFNKTVLDNLAKFGAPQELRDLLTKGKDGGGLGVLDTARMLRQIHVLMKRISDMEAHNMFNANRPPGTDGASGQEGQGKEDASKTGQQSGDSGSQKGRQGGDGKKGEQAPKDGFLSFNISDIMAWGIGAAVLYPFYRMIFPGESSREITWQELRKNFLDKGLVEKLVVLGNRVRVELNRQETQSMYPDTVAANPNFYYYFSIGSVEAFEKRVEEAQAELGIPPSERIPVSYAKEGAMTNFILAFGPTILLVGLLVYSMRRVGGGAGGANGVFGFGKSKAKMFNHESAVKVKFSDVAGMDEAKMEIMEFVSFLKSPEKFQRLGAKIPRGAILSGPPGTGKTLLAKATAGESQVPFFSVSGSEFVEMFVGVGASRVRDLFSTARKNAPCIIFIDEIDAVGRARGDRQRFGGNDEREATLNQILTEMDGFNTSEQVVVLAGTNRPDILDKALLRPGRFDRHIHIDRPTMKGRQEIFRVHLGKIVTNENMDHLTGRLAALTPGFAGADIANAVNEAALIAARSNAQTVQMIHFEQAIERVVGGLERKSLVLSPEEKKTVAYHEAGHAICGWYFQFADPLLKVSIIPRGQGALGYAQYLPATDAYLMNVNQLMDRMAMTLGGRVSEELHFPTVTTGASDDFKKVTQMASAMVTQWGMSEKLGPLSFNPDKDQLHKPFAESTAQSIDAEVRRIVDQAYKQCRELLTKRKKEVGLVAEELLRKEMLTRDDLVRLLGPRPWKEKEEFSKYFDGTGGMGGSGGKSAPPPFPAENTDSPPAPAAAVFKGL